MRTTIFFLIIMIVSCTNDTNPDDSIKRSQKDSEAIATVFESKETVEEIYARVKRQKLIEEENKRLWEAANAPKTKYAFATFEISIMQEEHEPSGQQLAFFRKNFISDIQKFDTWDKNTEYEFLDVLEKEVERKYPIGFNGVTERKAYSFNSYEEASEKRFQIKSKKLHEPTSRY